MKTSTKFWSVAGIAMALLAVSLHAEILYVANSDNNSIYAYRIAGNGALKELTGSPFSSGKGPVSVAVDPLGRFLYTANMDDGTISVFHIRPNGRLTRVSDLSAGRMPKSLAVDPFGRFLYVTNLDGNHGIPDADGAVGHVRVFRISTNGTLPEVPGSPFPVGNVPVCVVADPLGRFVYVAGIGSQLNITKTISAYRVSGNGTLTPLAGSPFLDAELPQSMAIDPFARFLYTAGEFDLALQTFDIAWSGILTYLPGSSFHPGGGHQLWNTVVADPFGRFVYTSSGLSFFPANAVFSTYRVGAKGLTFASSYPAGFVANTMVVDLKGEFFYAGVNVVKGANGPVEGTGIAAYRVNGNGTLTPLPDSPFLVGFAPDSMAVSP